MISRRHLIGVSAAAALAPGLAGRSALAQAWPTRPVRLLVGLAAGGAIDATARIVGAKLSEFWGQQVVVENKTGAASNFAAEAVARSDPDGYTLLVASFPHATSRFLYSSLGWDPVADFAPVTLICLYPNIMVVPNSSPARSVQEFIDYAKANKGKLTYASSGHGTSLHFGAELFQRMAGIEMTHVPYRGAGQAFNDIVPGRVDVMFNLIASSLPLVRTGQLRALGVATAKRVEAAPDLPTISEAGVPGFEMSSSAAIYAPAKTPAEIVKKVHADTVAALADPSIQGRLQDLGVVLVGSSPDGLAAYLQSEMDKWGPVIKQAGITIRD